MKAGSSVRLLVIFTVAIAMLVMVNFTSAPSFAFPKLPIVRGCVGPYCNGGGPWVPSGPSMDTLTYPLFTDTTAEFNAIQASPSPIDFTDLPLDPATATTLTNNPNFIVTSPISGTLYYELEFNLANNYWGCTFNFGNSACGTNIRQAFAHGIDKNQFLTELPGNGQAIDDPVPPDVDLNTPNPCSWDSTHVQTGSNCIVNGAGGTAYHLQSSTVAGVACPNLPSTPQFSFTPQCGTPDFCAAADHLIAAGIATGKNSSTCVLTGLSASVASNPINFFIPSISTPLLHAGDSFGQFLCALFTGAFSTGCTGVNVIPVPSGNFPGFSTSPTSINLGWWVYVATVIDMPATPDASLYYMYNSQFVDGVTSIRPPTGPCSSAAVPGYSPSNYVNLCNSSFDTSSQLSEFAPCLTAAGDPTTGQTTPTFADCTSTTQLSAASAAYQAQNVFGQNAFTIPMYSPKMQFAYLNSGWSRTVLHNGDGFTPPGNYFLTLNAWIPTPPVAGTIRQGFGRVTTTSNPFVSGNTIGLYSNAGIVGSVYDSLGMADPQSPQAYMDWMTTSTAQIPTAQLGYTAPAGTVLAFRYTLRSDNFWQTGQPVTAWDVAFSYIAYKANGVMPGLSPMVGVKVLSPTQIDVLVNAVGPFTQLGLSNPIIPARDWVNNSVCTASTWDADVSNMNFAAANAAVTGCIAPSSAVTTSGVILPIASNVDNSKVQPSYDPATSANSNLIGSGPWECTSSATFPPASTTIGSGCSSTGKSMVGAGGTWTLQRYGRGTTPGGTLNTYFRSTGNLMLWSWSQDRGNFNQDFLNFGQVALCFGKAVGTAGCTVWQHGIGGSAGGTVIGLTQVSIVQRFVGVNWTSPYNWAGTPPQGIDTFPPVLYEGTSTFNPCSIDPVNGYDC